MLLPMSSSVKQVYREKLDYLLEEEAKASDPEQKFRLKKLIAEVKDKLGEADATLELASGRVTPTRRSRKLDGLWGLRPVPSLPPHYLPRSEDLAPLKSALLASTSEKVRGIVGVQGMGGIGKSVLAAAICRDREVRDAFADGIVWITIGQLPNIRLLQLEFARELGARGYLI